VEDSKKKHTANNQKKKHQIDAIEVTSDCLTSRARSRTGLELLVFAVLRVKEKFGVPATPS
jgi:hypothetical protein